MEIEQHNATVYRCMEAGDMIEFKRGTYSHWGVCVGAGDIVHLTGDNDGIGDNPGSAGLFATSVGANLDKAEVVRQSFWLVTGDSKAYINNRKDRKHKPLPKSEIIDNALSSLGSIGYNVIKNNCEHFAAMCRYGVSWSEQVDTVLSWAWLGTTIAAGVGILYALTKPRATSDRRN